MHYWLLKSEPNAYSIDELARAKTGVWDGVRNYVARNNICKMKKGDVAFFYHSNTKDKGIVGTMTIGSTAYPDPTQFDTTSVYYDSKSEKENPRWYAITVRFKRKFKHLIPLSVLKNDPQLASLQITQKGDRLSVQKVSKDDFLYIIKTYTGGHL